MARWRDLIRSFFARQTQSYWPNRGTRVVYVQSTLAGVRVTPDTALQQATVWACVQVLSKSIAQLPWRCMRQTAPGTSLIVPGSLDDLLNHRPNPEMSAFTFRQTMIGHALLWGNSYAEIERDGAGRAVALWPIEPDRVWVKRWWDTGRLYYQVNNQTKGIVDLDYMDMFHVHGLSFDGVTGYQTVGYAAQSIGLAMAIERFGAAFFGNNGQLGGVIKNKKTNLDSKGREALLASFNEKHQGPDRAFRIEYLDGEMDFATIGVEPEKGQFTQSAQNQVETICRWFGVPPHKVAHLLRSTNNNIEHQGIEFVTDGILPWTVMLEQEADYKLINPRNPQGYYTRIDVRSLQRGDLAGRSAFYTSMFDRGVMSVNDIREAEGMNTIDEEDGGDKRFVPLNMQLLEDAGATDPEDTTEAADPSIDTGGDQSGGGSEVAPGDGPSARSFRSYSPDQERDDHGRFAGAPGTEIAKPLNQKEKTAIRKYTSIDYVDMNGQMRGEVAKNATTQKHIDALSSAIEKSNITSPGTLFRGVSIEPSEFQVGKSITVSGFVSTSMDRSVAERFMGWSKEGTLLEIHAKSGHALNLDIADPSPGIEHEVVLPHRSTFHITSVSGNHVKMELA